MNRDCRAATPAVESKSARLQLPLLDPQVARKVGIVAPHLLDESLGILAADERLDGVTERVVEA
jgi:hypothetical protein